MKADPLADSHTIPENSSMPANEKSLTREIKEMQSPPNMGTNAFREEDLDKAFRKQSVLEMFSF